MFSTTWQNLAVSDDTFEVRELVHLSARREFADFFKLEPGTVSPDASAIVGRAGFLFVNDGSNKWKDQLNGCLAFTPEILDTTSAQLEEYNEKLSSRGISFRFVIVPEKDVVYSDLSPNVASSLATSRPALEIARRHSAFTLYVKDPLIEAASVATTFHARNSHFNFFGGLIVANQILSSLELSMPSEDKIPSYLVSWPDDLSLKWVPNLITRRRILKNFYTEEEVIKSESHVGRYLILRNEKALNKKSVAIFGDSYSWNPDAGISRTMALAFSEVHFLWKKQIDWDLIERIAPSVLILQSAERFLIKGLR